MTHPLATADQQWTELLALRLVERPDVRAAREQARALLLADPAAQSFSARLGLDRALDLWMMALAMREANGDPARPRVVWNVDNTPRHWLGHVYPGGAVAVDNPDNMNREMPIDGDGRYTIDIAFSDNPSSLSLVLEIEPEHHAGIGENVATLTTLDLNPRPGKTLTVTVDSAPTNGRAFHMQSRPGARLQLYARDSHADWAQTPAYIGIRRLDPVATAVRDEEDIVSAILSATVPFVRFWLGFKDSFLGFPHPNSLIGPIGRVGGWGFLAGGRYAIPEGKALLVRIDPARAAYNGFQVTDPFTIAPDPVHRTSSLNTTQTVADADGGFTYVVAARDPGTPNWIDTVGLTEGWMLLRWQGVSPDADPARFIREVRLIDLDAIPPDLPRATLADRIAAIDLRARLHHARTRT
ncbi:hypothetical protein [Sphingobium sp. TCM1]|uniref:hypothetical protein n=1 Tax=Sphingobium sp. TCM1 TaxID=453246 RepID=UPI0007F3A872|nr:hypothetical protein [Sphingobium sp. TCM1]OAN56216.1 hypothetical protein A7Q26_02060 [Sphingobium sp. TCM1]